jgi:arginase
MPDLDVLDPGGRYARARRLDTRAVVAAVRDLTARFPLAGVGITEYEPDRPADRAALAKLGPVLLT